MAKSMADWVAEKLEEEERLEVSERTTEGFLVVSRPDGYRFLVAVLNVQGVICLRDVVPLFAGTRQPHFVVNVPSKTLWSGEAIRCIHAASAAFGTLGDVSRAASTGNAGSFRDKKMGFFIKAIEQHTKVAGITYIYDRVLKAERTNGTSLTIAVIDAYNMSAEDVRNARERFGHFDVIVKSTSHGSITPQAESAAMSMNAEALVFRELMGRLAK